jgi:hypothetical protein
LKLADTRRVGTEAVAQRRGKVTANHPLTDLAPPLLG